ncbi:CmcJ/NvfI family oxidoreductase [Microbacterium sp. 18062]|uniref:CmcJ/NvfI family oxidoreductase n=1 Tax=Microbacterium sp. 18062 TaxID=2681410 RepID=UPI0013597CFB|nr:CmcJ/NvfI family oxidoreductase [Microbacterium sp. 18062]
MSTSTLPQVQTVVGELNYLDPYSKNSGLFVAPGDHVDAGVYRGYEVTIRNGRPVQDRFTLERHGFTLLNSPSPLTDFTDKQQIDEVYLPSALETVREALGADLIIPGNVTMRMGEAPGDSSAQPAAAQVHCDVSAPSGVSRFAEAYEKSFPGGRPFKRAIMTSFWRVINEPPQDWPLTLCNYESVEQREGVLNPLVWVDKLPSDPQKAIEELDRSTVQSGSVFYYNPDHEWWYFPEMTRDEALLFTLNDSDQSHAWRALHSAFRDPTVTADHTRHSIEFRTIGFFL